MKIGIDVSTWNRDIDWEKAKESGIEFAMIRAGYGVNNIDSKAVDNMNGCTINDIPFGLYWFSYAYNEEMAVNEANNLCEIADLFTPSYPLCFDYEYDSDACAKRNGVSVSNELRYKIAKAFLSTVESRGYYAMLYTNIDYLSKGFLMLTDKYDLWIAKWSTKKPKQECGMWQYSANGKVNGINGYVDMNIAYKDYSCLCKKKHTILNKERNVASVISDTLWENYNRIAIQVIAGKFGNGIDREKALREIGYDYTTVQNIVNLMLKDGIYG